MTRRIFPLLLMMLLPLLMTACGTSPAKPEKPAVPVTEASGRTQAVEPEDRQIRPGFWADPSQRSLSEVIALSKSMPVYQAEIALEIVRSLESLDSAQLDTLIRSQRHDPEFTEWLELALQLRTAMINGGPVTAAARNWELYHFGHPVTQAGFTELLSAYRTFYPVPARVAVLLPNEGGLETAAAAIRDGIMTAYLDRPGDASLRFYPSGRSGESAIAAYRQALEEGATQVVGPLRLDSTQALAAVANLSVPVLLLNKAEDGQEESAENADIVSSLSLSQSEEAVTIARAVLQDGQQNAIVIVPDSAWGRRVENAFSAEFVARGGHIAARAQFNRSTNDYSDMLTRLLKIDQSLQRKRDLQARIGTPLSFEPSRRHDFDFIFMAASPQEGRELKPLLRFHDAGDVPVYSISPIYSGRDESARDQDLDGIIFTTVPWQLKPDATEGPLPESVRDGSLGRLYALGKDAWRLLPWLPLMHKDKELKYPGQVGELRLQPNGQIARYPAWAQFVAGTPIPYQWPAPR
jgi:outer membrane PBP1 activator LpoA protein